MGDGARGGPGGALPALRGPERDGVPPAAGDEGRSGEPPGGAPRVEVEADGFGGGTAPSGEPSLDRRPFALPAVGLSVLRPPGSECRAIAASVYRTTRPIGTQEVLNAGRWDANISIQEDCLL